MPKNENLENFINSVRDGNYSDAKTHLSMAVEEKFETYIDGIDETEGAE